MDRQTVKLAIAAADSAGMASGFAQGIAQVADNVRKQVEIWKAIQKERYSGSESWLWNIVAPWGIPRWLRARREAVELRASIAALESLEKLLRDSVTANHEPDAKNRRATAQQYAEAALRPGLLQSALSSLGGAAKRSATAK